MMNQTEVEIPDSPWAETYLLANASVSFMLSFFDPSYRNGRYGEE
jgi:hypothetical protein